MVGMTKQQIIAAIEAHAKQRKIAPATVTSRAVGNSRLYQRLVDGGDCTTEVAARIAAWIERDALPRQPSDAA
jgi:hypothetical protein